MKKIFFAVVFLSTAFKQYSFAQDSTKTQHSLLLTSYYDIKNALVAGNANSASMKAEEFVKTLNGSDLTLTNEATRKALLKDARTISASKDIQQQRERFVTFSANMYALAKAVKLTTEPVYYAYCPMKKAYWLSSEAAIKNPYFGSSMLTCGKIEETLK